MQFCRLNNSYFLVFQCWYLILLVYSTSVNASTIALNNIGARAGALAGAFVSQANDSSAVWYNPAGLIDDYSASLDMSVELESRGLLLHQQNLQFDPLEKTNIRQMTLSKKFRISKQQTHPLFALGFAILEPYQSRYHIDQISNLVTSRPYGRVVLEHRQYSFAFASTLARFKWGLSLDHHRSNVKCETNNTCISAGPAGNGISMAMLTPLFQHNNYLVQLGANWRSPIKLQYAQIPVQGIAKPLIELQPQRPQSQSVGLTGRSDNQYFLVFCNLALEHLSWRDYSALNNVAARQQRLSAGLEFIFSLHHQLAFMTRVGWSQIQSKNQIIQNELRSIGIGLGWQHKHFLDVALAYSQPLENTEVWHVSLSYSFQRF
ncbi:MAG: hypothetical protein OEZ58_21850 [Gammaproteobacteria bacterium]|nr:hypothetical protein [Gammaproteobacteria bacterium]MDH5731635.1 hypothetical protein [Gammaproteobacteria bacterium]